MISHPRSGCYQEDRRRSIATYKKAKWMLESYIFLDLWNKPIGDLKAPELLVVLKKIETKGLHETARHTKQRCGQVFRHAIGLGYAQRDITVDLRGLLETPIVEHHASITDPAKVGALLRAIDNCTGRVATVCGLKLAPFLPCSRPTRALRPPPALSIRASNDQD